MELSSKSDRSIAPSDPQCIPLALSRCRTSLECLAKLQYCHLSSICLVCPSDLFWPALQARRLEGKLSTLPHCRVLLHLLSGLASLRISQVLSYADFSLAFLRVLVLALERPWYPTSFRRRKEEDLLLSSSRWCRWVFISSRCTIITC